MGDHEEPDYQIVKGVMDQLNVVHSNMHLIHPNCHVTIMT